jgi:DNA-binding NarL/FixJ family response regulator
MLCGRDAELGSITQLLEDAKSSRSGVLVVRGEPGVGKSALLEEVVERATGVQVLRATGVQTESEIAFAALDQIVRPLLGHLDEIPPPQAAALRTALGLGDGAEPPRFLIAVAVLSLLAAGAESEPLLVVIDDAQWLDEASAQALTFAARRLEAEGIAAVFAAREGDEQSFDAPGLPELRLTGLEPAAADILLGQPGGDGLAPEVRDQLVRATGGNPLALLELPRLLSADQLAGREPLSEPLPVSQTIEAAFLERARALPASSQTLLLVAACEDTGDPELLLRAADLLAIEVAAFTAAEATGLVRFEADGVRFRHPLVRSALYQGASLPERRAAHATLAEALEGEEYADRRAWHKAAATIGRNDEVAAELERSADRARRRSGYAAAASAFERAADLTADEGLRARRLFGAADAAGLAGRVRHAGTLLDTARSLAPDALLRADIDRLRGSLEFELGELASASKTLLEGADQVAELDKYRALYMLMGAWRAAAWGGELTIEMEVAKRTQLLGGLAGNEFELAWMRGIGKVLDGDVVGGMASLREALDAVDDVGDPRQLSIAAEVAIYLADLPLGRAFAARTIAAGRAMGAIAGLAYGLTLLGSLEVRDGLFTSGIANASEGLRLARETGQLFAVSTALTAIANAEAYRGNEDACREAVAEAFEMASAHGLGVLQARPGSWALAELDLTMGRFAEALARFEGLAETPPGTGQLITLTLATPDLVEAAARAGRPDAAVEPLASYTEWVEAADSSTGLALAARCRGLLAEGAEAEEHFEQALHLHAAEPRSFPAARTALVYGEALRRARRRRDARDQLRAALEVFEQIGAAPWAERARNELRASGESARRREPSTLDQLTRQELQIARFVAEGLTNRQVAEQLFLSPRTIDFHLRNVFRKLNIASRSELGRVMANREIVYAG